MARIYPLCIVYKNERSCWKKMKLSQTGQFFLSFFSNYAFIPIDDKLPWWWSGKESAC